MGVVMINRKLHRRRQIVGKVRKVSYGSEQIKIVEGGIDAIGMALYNGSEEEKASILFCLDRFLDPYYGYHLPYESDIFVLLQNLLFEENSNAIKEDILDLLQFYCEQPLDILENGLDKLSGELLSHAKYVLYDEE